VAQEVEEPNFPDNVRVATKFHPKNGAVGIVLPKDGHAVFGAESGLPLVRRKPALNPRRDHERDPKSLPGGSRKERLVGKGMVRDKQPS